MQNLGRFSFSEAHFDENGNAVPPFHTALPPNIEDLFIISHGWRNDENDARTLYSAFFASVQSQLSNFKLDPTKAHVLGIFWPAEYFDESLASPAAARVAGSGGAAGIGSADGSAGDGILNKKLKQMLELFTASEQQAALQKAKILIPTLETKTSDRIEFVKLLRSLFNGVPGLASNQSDAEDASLSFFTNDAETMINDLRLVDEDDEFPPVEEAKAGGGAAGFEDMVDSFKAAALRALNYTSYFEMKRRAGEVGQNGVAPMVNEIAKTPTLNRIHLIGHSFGGRLVASAAAYANTKKLKSMTLLQAAFSHNGFSESQKGVFRQVVDKKTVSGPILITYSKYDTANGRIIPQPRASVWTRLELLEIKMMFMVPLDAMALRR